MSSPQASVGGINYNVTPEYVHGAAIDTNNTAELVQDELVALKGYIQTIPGFWQGMSADKFQQVMADYDVASQTLHHALTEIGSGLLGNATNYTESESSVLANVQSLDIPPLRM